MLQFLGFLLLVWIVLSVAGFLIEGLLWLALIGLGLFVLTSIFYWVKRKARGASSRV